MSSRQWLGPSQRSRPIYQLPFLAHATMEPMNCTVHVRQDGCEVWVGSQALARVQAAAAKTAGLPLEKVVVHNHLIGGGFGRRLEADGVARAVQIAQACRRAGESRLDPRGRHPARHVPAVLVRSDFCGTRRERAADRLEQSLRRFLGSRKVASSGVQQGPRPGYRRRARSTSSTICRTFTSSMCGWNPRAFQRPSGEASGLRTTCS